MPLREMTPYARLPAQARMIPAISPMMTANNKIIESYGCDEKDFGLVKSGVPVPLLSLDVTYSPFK